MKITALAVLLSVASAHAWDAAGHMLVGQVAWELSSPAVRAAVDEMVATLDSRYNDGQPYNFTTVSCWMDDLRALPKSEYPWSAWHYMDAEKTADGSAFKVAQPPHVVWAVGENMKTLRDRNASGEERAKALGMLFHWVGDIHQPLHTTTWNDRGGNGYLISGVHFSDLMPGQIANLHTFWDKSFRFDVREGAVVELWANPKIGERPKPGQGIIGEEARELMRRFPKATLTELAQLGSAETWARESHILGCKSGYPPGDHPGNTEAPRLTPEFAHAAYEISGRRIVLAGHRMAALLAEIFEGKK